LTQFPERDYTYLFSRLRRLKDSEVPLRMRGASNPGGIGHSFVKKRFMSADSVAQGRKFVKATLDDNPHLDREAYRQALQNLDAVTRRQLGEGDWSDFKGERFRPGEWPKFTDLKAEAWAIRISAEHRKVYRRDELIFLIAVDWATSAKKTADHTAMGCGVLTPDNTLLLMEVINARLDLEDCVPTLARFCRKWHPHLVGCEALAFQASLANECRRYREIPEVRRLMPGSAAGAKLKRALPAIIMGENGRIFLPEEEAQWQDPFIAQLSAFTGVEKDEEDDMVDMLAYLCLMAQDLRPTRKEGEGEGPILLYEGRGQI
jgi:predicted phage terminase large subunit-like protein